MSKFVQSRRVDALTQCHAVLIRFGGRTGTVLSPKDPFVAQYAKDCTSKGQNLFGAMFFSDEAAKKIVLTAIEKDVDDLLEVNSGPLGLSAPRLQRMADARTEWSKK